MVRVRVADEAIGAKAGTVRSGGTTSASDDDASRFDPDTSEPGIFPWQLLGVAARERWISSESLSEDQLQPASVDLTLSDVAYRLQCSFLPDREVTVAKKLESIALEEFSISRGAVLERNRAYLIPLREQLALPEKVRGKANPKSSTGRLDVFTRVISDRNARFDEIGPGYHGPLYLEVVPRSFIIRVKEGLSLNQLRLSVGEPAEARCSDGDLASLHLQRPLLWLDSKRVPAHDLDLAEGLFLSLDLNPDEHGHVGYRARRNSRVIDLSVVGDYAWDDFWEPVRPERDSRLILEPEDFYLLLSRESVAIPPALSAEMTAYDPTAGELRTHYAGFFDPGFGYRSAQGPNGSRATLEVRARDVPFMVETGQRVCRLVFERLIEATKLLYGVEIGSTYQNQTLTLSKHFTSQVPKGQLRLPGVRSAKVNLEK